MARIIQDSDDEADAITPVVTPVRQAPIQISTDDPYQSKMAQFNEYLDSNNVDTESYNNDLNRTTKRRKLSHSSYCDGDATHQLDVAINPRGLPEALFNPPPMATGSDLISTLPDNTYQQMQIVAQAETVTDPFDFPADASSQLRRAKISSGTKSSSLPWTQIRAFENEEAADENAEHDHPIPLEEILAPDIQENDVENFLEDDIKGGCLQGDGEENATFTPPGTPVKADTGLAKKSSKKSKSAKKLKKRKKTVIDEGDLSEDELSMVNTTLLVDEKIVEPVQTPLKKGQDQSFTKAQVTRASKVHKSPDVSVVIPVPNTRLSASEEQRLASAVEEDEEVEKLTENEVAELESPTVESITPIKRGRGRPKKTAVKDSVETSDKIPSVSKVTKQKIKEVEAISTTIQQETLEDDSEDVKGIEERASITIQTSIVTTDNKENDAPTYSTSTRVATKSNTQSGKGKTVHRVGLSRRVHIAPLLKIVRK